MCQASGLALPDGFDVDSLDGQVAILLGAGAALPTHLADVPITVRQVTAGYRNVIKMRYANSSADLDRNLRLCDQLDRQAGDLDADPYGPLKLQELRDGWVQDRKDRRYCNRLTNAVRRIFKWAVSQELIEESTWRRLLAVEPLRAGQTDAPDNEPVQPVERLRPPPGVIDHQLDPGVRTACDHRFAGRDRRRDRFLTEDDAGIGEPCGISDVLGMVQGRRRDAHEVE